jgi:hypothetical protein
VISFNADAVASKPAGPCSSTTPLANRMRKTVFVFGDFPVINGDYVYFDRLNWTASLSGGASMSLDGHMRLVPFETCVYTHTAAATDIFAQGTKRCYPFARLFLRRVRATCEPSTLRDNT